MHRDASREGDRREEMRQEMAGKVHPVEAGATGAELRRRGMAEGWDGMQITRNEGMVRT